MSAYSNNPAYITIETPQTLTVEQLMAIKTKFPGLMLEHMHETYDANGDNSGYEVVFELPYNMPKQPISPVLTAHNWSYNIEHMVQNRTIPTSVTRLLQQIAQTEEYLEEQQRRAAHKQAAAAYIIELNKFNIEVREQIEKICNSNLGRT